MAILDAGAYGSVMASTYNRRPLLPEVLIDDEHSHEITKARRHDGAMVQQDRSWRVIRRRQTIDELLSTEL